MLSKRHQSRNTSAYADTSLTSLPLVRRGHRRPIGCLLGVHSSPGLEPRDRLPEAPAGCVRRRPEQSCANDHEDGVRRRALNPGRVRHPWTRPYGPSLFRPAHRPACPAAPACLPRSTGLPARSPARLARSPGLPARIPGLPASPACLTASLRPAFPRPLPQRAPHRQARHAAPRSADASFSSVSPSAFKSRNVGMFII